MFCKTIKSFLMQTKSRGFSSVWKRCVSVNYNLNNTRAKISSNIFLSSHSLKYLLKNATIYNSRNKGVMFMI